MPTPKVADKHTATALRRLYIGATSTDTAPAEKLTRSEVEVVALIATRGLTNQQVADELTKSVRTVDTHVASAFRKTGATNRVQLVLAFQKVSA